MGVYVQGKGWRVGPSSFGNLKGVEQYVAVERHADQLNSLAFEFDERPESNAAGIRLSVNEGIRSDELQYQYWNAWETYCKYGTPYASLAARPLTSTHRKAIGTAFDIGITLPDGTNRAPTAAEWEWIHARAALRGIVHTGQWFNPREEWHHNAGYAESLAPIPGVRIANTPIAPPAPDPIAPEEETMQLSVVSDKGKPFDGDIVATGDTFVRHTVDRDDAYSMGRFIPGMPVDADSDGELRAALSKQGRVINQGQLQRYVQHVRTIGGYVDPRYKTL